MRKLKHHPFENAIVGPPAARRGWRPATRRFAGEFAIERSGSSGASTSPPGPQPTVVIGEDDRQQVKQTKTYPARAIAQIRVLLTNGGTLSSTGWFISPSVIVTAAHVVSAPGQSIKTIAAAPGRNANTLPYGYADGVKWKASSRWDNQPGSAGDYAAIELAKPLGSVLGFFGLRSFSNQQLSQGRFWVAGYPIDKTDGTMWAHEGPVTPSELFLQYTTDTEAGESGAPVFVKMTDGIWAAGIHVGGVDGVGNRAVRITSTVFNELEDWKGGL